MVFRKGWFGVVAYVGWVAWDSEAHEASLECYLSTWLINTVWASQASVGILVGTVWASRASVGSILGVILASTLSHWIFGVIRWLITKPLVGFSGWSLAIWSYSSDRSGWFWLTEPLVESILLDTWCTGSSVLDPKSFRLLKVSWDWWSLIYVKGSIHVNKLQQRMAE